MSNPETITAMMIALERAESFIAGFEGDESQEGIDELLEAIRGAVDGTATPIPPTIRITVEGGVVQSVECSIPAAVVLVDYDIEGADESDLEEYGNAEAYVSRYLADPLEGEA